MSKRRAGGARGALVIGAGRHAAEVLDALEASGIRVQGCLDAVVPVGTEVYPHVEVVGRDTELGRFIDEGFARVYLGIGGLNNLETRIRWFTELERLRVRTPALVHPAAHVAPTAEIGAGTTVLARASIGPLTRVGRNCVITQGAVITHHCCIGDHVVVAPGALLAAGVRVGERATIGMGVSVYHDLEIGREAVIVNGVDVMQDVPEGAVVKHARIPAAIRQAGACSS